MDSTAADLGTGVMSTMTIMVTNGTGSSPTSEVSNIVITALIGLFLVLGSVGNVLTVATIGSTTQLQTISNYFICSLCLSDLFSAIICSPLWLYRRTWGFDSWSWGEFLCKFYWVSDFTTNYVTALHIASFAAFRFTAVRRPFRIWDIPKKKIVLYLVVLWFTSLVVALPLIYFMGIREKSGKKEAYGGAWPSCSILERHVNQYHLYTLIVYPTIFLLPLLLIIVFSVLLIKRLIRQKKWFSRVNDSSKSEDLTTVSSQVVYGQGQQRAATTALGPGDKKSRKKKKQVSPSRGSPTTGAAGFNNKKIDRVDKRHRRTFLQLGLVVASFMIGYIPTSAYLMWTSVTENKSIGEDYWFGVGSYLCLRFSECLNPLMYNLGSNKLRKATAKFLARLYRRMFHSK